MCVVRVCVCATNLDEKINSPILIIHNFQPYPLRILMDYGQTHSDNFKYDKAKDFGLQGKI